MSQRITTDEAFEIILSNFRTQIEEDLRSEENMSTPDKEIIEQYEEAIDKLDQFNEYKLVQHTMDYISESVGL